MVLAMIAGGSLASAGTTLAAPPGVDHERAFVEAFPVSGGERVAAFNDQRRRIQVMVLELVDADGHVRWTAPATAPAHRSR